MKNVLFSLLVMVIVLTSCKDYDDEFDALNASVAALQSQVSSISTLQSSLTTLQNTVTSLQTSLDSSDLDLSSILVEIASLQADLNGLTVDFTNANFAEIQAALAALEVDLAELLESNSVANLTLNLSGLDELGSDFVYEGWIIVDGAPVSTGTFSSVTFPQIFIVNINDLALATKFVLSIEPAIDDDPAPAATKILVGDFSGNSAIVSTGIVGDFSSSAGSYILATPTDGADNNENSGIWFLDPTSGSPLAGLNLPTLGDGWVYEGWVVIDGMPVTTGTFTNLSATDNADPFSGDMPLPAPNGDDGFFPGEDFLMNAPGDLTFPTDIAGGTAVISVEPFPDNNPGPFTLKPLVGGIPDDAVDHSLYGMMQNLGSLPTGTVTR